MAKKKEEAKLEIVWLDPNTLTPYTNNAKKHPTEQIDKLAGQIAEFGFDQPIVVDKNKVIIKGHGRREAALRLGLKTVPVVVADHLDEFQVKAARIGDNQVASLGTIDKNLLKFELGTLQRADYNLKLTAFELGDIDKILSQGDVEEESGGKSSESSGEEETQETENENSGEGDTDNADDNVDGDAAQQFIVAVHCTDEDQMKLIYEEMVNRGLDVKLIT